MRVLDFIAEHGFDASRVESLPEADRPRAMALIRQMGVLDAYPADEADDALVDATLARIDRYEDALAEARRVAPARQPTIRLSGALGIAALVMLGLGTAIPMASELRRQSLVNLCGSNLRSMHAALDAYADANGGSLPLSASIGDLGEMFRRRAAPARTAGQAARGTAPPAEAAAMPDGVVRPRMVMQAWFQFPGGTFVVVEGVRSWSESHHSKHLDALVDGEYASHDDLRCPACSQGRPCFAYRVPTRGQRFMLDTPMRTVTVADANPMIEDHRLGRPTDRRALNSRNHSEAGQNMLFSDGSVEWRLSPMIVTGQGLVDNIWLPREDHGRDRLELRSWPTAPEDNFVAQ
jgi:hypothetical protein